MQIFLKTKQNSSVVVWKRISVDGALDESYERPVDLYENN